MRKSLLLVGIPIAAVGVALAVAVGKWSSEKKETDTFAEELKRAQVAGLELAQSQGANKFALSEIASQAKPEARTTIKRGTGPKAVRSPAPTVTAAPEPVTAEVAEEIPTVQMSQAAEAPGPVEVIAPAIPRPVPAATRPYPVEDDGPILAGGAGRGTGRRGDGLGGIFVAVIRGGAVDHDNCDPRGGGMRPAMRTPVYGANPTAGGSGGAVNTSVRMGLPAPSPRVASRPRG
jgi:hypothetical protein